ncbi:Rpn family recombination-promoting nuclease/putative transposase [Photorhabdus heterorhabditis]|uniref:Transposase n=1 Tax=Photorhabdus heterorhabditis TaxID=880156 RepID=A0ABR5K6P6_9GAMM|nr:Rpn family recombination-promoting nuclease/putative transposase [Photorhabdus heterorhabditis]KOY60133.1 transposase [Photorhabdus heterorhabditis]MBS9444473.1 Rpn family recombination-promoting nuclease/putative transposase [Photorhabdus heterorhabditis]
MKKNTTPTLHDAIFKQFLTHPDTARDFLQFHLPLTLLKVCDLNTLQLVSGSFIEDDLRPYYSDVLYSLKTGKGDGYVYCLIEHQSSPDKHMAFRMLRYAIAAMQRHLDAGHKTLPLVIPVLFYQGKISPYPYPMNWLLEFDDPELAGELYNKDFPLVDITVIPDDEIMKHRRMAVLEMLQKHIRQRDLTELLDQLVTLLLEGYTTQEQLISVINYMLQAGESHDPAALLNTLASRVPQHEEALMTIAEKLRLEGEQRGIRKGMQLGEQKGLEEGVRLGEQKGREEGVRLGKLDVAHSLLKMGMPREAVLEATGLSEDELAQIRH